MSQRALISDLLAAYASPTEVHMRQLALTREERVLGLIAIFALLSLVASVPEMRIRAAAESIEWSALFGAYFVAHMLLLPLALYAISGLVTLVIRRSGASLSWVHGRAIFVFSALVSLPFLLIASLLEGFGLGAVATSFNLAGFVVFLWQYIIGVRTAGDTLEGGA